MTKPFHRKGQTDMRAIWRYDRQNTSRVSVYPHHRPAAQTKTPYKFYEIYHADRSVAAKGVERPMPGVMIMAG